MYYIWLDDVRESPLGFKHTHSVNETMNIIRFHKGGNFFLDLDHDLGDYSKFGGDGINLIKTLLEEGYHVNDNYTFHFKLHTMNPVGMENMKSLIIRYFGKESYHGC